MRTALSLLIGLVVVGIAGDAVAGPLTPFVGLDCPSSGKIAHDRLVGALLDAADVKWSSEVGEAFGEGRLGTLVVADGSAFEALKDLADILVADGPSQPEAGFSAVIVRPPPENVIESLLNRDGGRWIEVRCTPARPQQAQTSPVVNPSPQGGVSWLSNVIIGGTEDDAAVLNLADRTFATFSFTADREADEEIVEANIFVGLPSFGLKGGPDGPFRPWVLYQRRTGGEAINDLTFALEAEWLSRGIFASAQYETDDDFNSEVHRANLDWFPSWSSFCGATVHEDWGGSCRLILHADHVQVKAVGAKADLAGIDEFTRLGATLKTTWWWRLEEGGVVEASARYHLWEPIDGEDGDAAQGALSLSWMPRRGSPFSFGVEYLNGEDATSLVRSETLKFAFGFRR